MDDIDAELDEAMAWTDQGRLDRLQAERDALLTQVRAATGLGGRRRHFSSTDERARVAVRKAIAATLQRLDDRDPALARLLRDTIQTGARCRYEPDPAQARHLTARSRTARAEGQRHSTVDARPAGAPASSRS